MLVWLRLAGVSILLCLWMLPAAIGLGLHVRARRSRSIPLAWGALASGFALSGLSLYLMLSGLAESTAFGFGWGVAAWCGLVAVALIPMLVGHLVGRRPDKAAT